MFTAAFRPATAERTAERTRACRPQTLVTALLAVLTAISAHCDATTAAR